MCQIIEELESYLQMQRQVTDDEMCRVYLKRIQHLYYKVCLFVCCLLTVLLRKYSELTDMLVE